MKLSVVIVNYNVCHYLVQCLDSVLRAINGMEADIWVVDNASTDDSVAYAQRLYPQVHFIQNEENVGFSRANNLAIRLSQGEYVLLLNPDTIVGEDTLAGCVDFMDSHPEAGALGAQMLNRDGSFAFESRRGLPTPLTSFYKIVGLAHRYPTSRRFGRYYMRYLNENEPNRIEVISGAFMMLRREALDQVGLLDEDFFMYGEDVDLSYRILQGGWQNWYVPFRLLHYKGESTQKTSFRYVHNFYNAMLIFFRKHFARRYRIANIVVGVGVAALGAWELLRQNLQRFTRRLRIFFYQLGHEGDLPPEVKEKVAFVGTYTAWAAAYPLMECAGLEPLQQFEPTDDILKAFADGCTPRFLVFQTDPEVNGYSDILICMSQLSKRGHLVNIGTFNTKTQTLILPHATFH